MPVNATTMASCWMLLALANVGLAQDRGLAEAVEKRDGPLVQALLERKIDVNEPQPDGATALHWAAHWSDLVTAALLIRAGADVNAANIYGVTPLSLACENADLSMAEALLSAGANPNSALPTGETALMTAARTGSAGVVKALIARGADVNARETVRGQTPLMWAAAERHAAVVQVLVDQKANVHARSTAGFTPLLFAARHGDLATTRILLDSGVSVNEEAPDGMSALLIAIMRGHTAYAAFLLDSGADPNRGPGFVPLHWAAGEWPTELTGATTGILADDTEWSALGGLRAEAKLEMVKLLLASGADPNAHVVRNPPAGRDLIGAGPFLIAAKAADTNVLRLLVASGADPHVTTSRNTTALMAAAGRGQAGRSWVTEKGALEAVKLVFELGVDIHALDADGETALHVAASRGWDTVVQFLVASGARLNVKNKRGWTPLTIAEGVHVGNFYAHPSTAELLRRLGADPTPPGVNRGEP